MIEYRDPVVSNMIAGAIPAFNLDVEETITQISAGVLRDDRLHALYADDDEFVYYFAVSSRWVTGGEEFATPLSVVLPGHPEHRGDGVYVFGAASLPVVIKSAGELLLLDDADVAVESLAASRKLRVHEVEGVCARWALQPVPRPRREAVERAFGRLGAVMRPLVFWGLALYCVLLLGSLFIDRFLGADVRAERFAGAVRQIQYVSPLSEQLAQIQRISSVVVRAGGWIDGYFWKKDRGEAFEITLPGWVSRDYIEALGPGVVTDYNLVENLVSARKGKFGEVSKP